MRFRKRISLGKGVHLNLSKSGISLTAGIPGLSFNIGRHGSYLNAGIPGTGIYNRTRLGGGSSSKTSARIQSSNVPRGYREISIQISMDDDGQISIKDEHGIPIVDSHILREIKSHPDYKQKIYEMARERAQEINQEVVGLEAIFKSTPEIIKAKAVYEQYEALQPEKYAIRLFTTPKPTIENCRTQLEAQARQEIKPLVFWKAKELRESFVRDRIEGTLNQDILIWERERAEHERQEQQNKQQEDARFLKEYEINKALLERYIQGDESLISERIETLLRDIELPVKFSVDYDYRKTDHLLLVDLDLPEIEDFPRRKAEVLTSGKLNIKARNAKEIKTTYATSVCGLAIYFAGLFFNISTNIGRIVVSGYTQRLNPTNGLIEDQYVYSAIFERSKFEIMNIEMIDPIAALSDFNHKIGLTGNFDLKTIKPFAEEDFLL